MNDNSAKLEDLTRAYAPGAVAAAMVSTVMLTGVGQIATWFAGRALRPETRLGFALCWALAVATLPLLLLSRRQILAPNCRSVPNVYWFQSIVQLTWLSLLVWYVTPAYTPLLFFVLCLLLFNDTRIFYNALELKVLYVSMWIAQGFVLLLVDAVGREGILWTMRNHPTRAAVTLIAEVCVAVLSVVIVEIAGKGHYDRDVAFRKRAELENALASMKTERNVLARSCDFLLQGLTAGRFSHDVASPVSVLAVEVARLRDLLHQTGDGRIDERLERCLKRIESAAERTQALTHSLARSLRDPGDAIGMELGQLIAQSIRHAQLALERHSITLAEPEVRVESVSVRVSRDHAAAIGNVLVNGALQRPDKAIQIVGASATPYFCRLAIRDWGVSPEERGNALARVHEHMSLRTDETVGPRLSEYDGHGIGLLLTKALLVRWGGSMAVFAPEEGAGLRFEFVLPKVDPAIIPDEHNVPERIIATGRAVPA